MSREVIRLALGSNLGDRETLLDSARTLLADTVLDELECSPVFETEPVGPAQGLYLNQVIRGVCDCDPVSLLGRCQAIENSLGRIRQERWGPRTIDIDILTYGEIEWRDESLTIPHPGIAERSFVLLPWALLEPQFEVPVLGKTVEQLLQLLGEEIPEGTER
ncbi:MAG: 2-amino-4-hydroxy-6-hydroxymethyldihydropteridine diphosphokinase [Planctomycetota bacterium]